jgi:hypothetical protein
VLNRVSLDGLRDMTGEQVATLPVDQIAMLLEDLAGRKAETKALEDLLNTALAIRYADRAAAQRRNDGKDTGTVSIEDGEFVIKADLPKKVEWNQAALREAEAVVRSWNEDPAQYLTAVLSVPESRYNAWPESIRKVFEPARTVGAGRPTFKIERAKRRAA